MLFANLFQSGTPPIQNIITLYIDSPSIQQTTEYLTSSCQPWLSITIYSRLSNLTVSSVSSNLTSNGAGAKYYTIMYWTPPPPNSPPNTLLLKGVKKVRSAIKLCSFYFSYNVSNNINVIGIFWSRLTWQEINNRMFYHIFCHEINDLQNQVPLGNFWARGAKWGYMTKNQIDVMQCP